MLVKIVDVIYLPRSVKVSFNTSNIDLQLIKIQTTRSIKFRRKKRMIH